MRDLQVIFQRVGEKDLRGLDDLHSFQQRHPEVVPAP